MFYAASWFFCTNIQYNPLWRHPTPTAVLPDFCFLTPAKDRHNSGHSHGLVYVNREQNVCLISSSPYVFGWTRQACGGWKRANWWFLLIMWAKKKKFTKIIDEYQMIHSSLAVIVLEFLSNPPLPPSSHPNGACTVSPPPSLHYIFPFLPGIWKLAGVRVSAMQAHCRHKRYQHTVQWSQEGGGEQGWREEE